MNREDEMVPIDTAAIESMPPFRCDPEIAPLVQALIHAEIATFASCSGHGHRPGNIVLADGRELVIARDYAEARRIDALFPIDINGEVRRALSVADFAKSPISDNACPFREVAEYLSRFPDYPEIAAAFALLMASRDAAMQACARWDTDSRKGGPR